MRQDFSPIKVLRSPLLTWAIVATVLLLSIWVGSKSYQFFDIYGLQSPPLWALAFYGGLSLLGFGLLALRHMPLALTLLVATSVAADLPISTGTDSPINLTILSVAGLLALWILRMIVYEKRLQLTSAPMNGPLLGFILIATLSWLAGHLVLTRQVVLPDNALMVQAGQFAMYVLSAAAYFLAANHPLGAKELKVWTGIILGLGIIAIGSELLNIAEHPLPALMGAMHMWPFVLLVAHLLFNPTFQRFKWQLLGWPILGLWAYWFLSIPWRFDFKGAWAPAFIAIVFLFMLRSLKLAILLGLAGVAILLLTGLGNEMIAEELSTGSGYRPLIWRDVWNMTLRSPFLGLGPANYMYYWSTLGADSLTARYIYEVYGHLWNLDLIAPPAHNMYVDILAQTGIIGLLIFLIFAYRSLHFGWSLAQRLPPGFLRAHTYGVLCGFVALLIGSFSFADWLIPFVYNISIRGFRHSVYSWLLLGTLVSIAAFAQQEQV